jgi:hypothetical protein
VTIEVEGDANDYAGKGLSGGRLIVYPPKEVTGVRRRKEHHHRQRGAVWSNIRVKRISEALRPNDSACETPGQPLSSKAAAITVWNT